MNTYKFKLDHYKNKIWCLNDDYHRDYDRPACIWSSGAGWFQHGKIHRNNDKPACIHSDGYKAWCQYGEYHRDNDKPARIWLDGRVEYWVNGKMIK
jgi:hypothetical protein